LESNGEFELAQKNGEAVLKKIEGLADLSPELRLDAYYLLAKVHQYQAENEASHEYGLKAIAWMNKHPEIDPSMQATMYNSMAVTNRNLGNNDTAEKQYLNAIKILRPIREKHVALSSMLVNLAILKGRTGDLVSSEALFLESFEVIKEIDENHVNLAMNYIQYTTLLQITGRLDEAKAILEKAITIFELHNMNKYLATAYMKYARIALIQYEVDVVLENLFKSYLLSKEIYGLDHPEIFDLYNMMLWVMMAEPYQAFGNKLLEQIETITVKTALNRVEYNRFQIQKAHLLKQATAVDLPEAVFTNFYLQQNNQQQFNADSQRIWLLHQLEIQSQKSDTLTAWSNLQIAIVDKDIAVIKSVCLTAESWNNSSHLAHKIMIIEACLSQSEQLENSVVSQLSQLHNQFSIITPKRQALIDKLLSMMP
jgi:tetratricopeptide (TPR) repeat protein